MRAGGGGWEAGRERKLGGPGKRVRHGGGGSEEGRGKGAMRAAGRGGGVGRGGLT